MNAEYYPLVYFYTWVILGYIAVDLLWMALCLRHRNQLIVLHHFLTLGLLFQTVQSIFMLIEYDIENSYGTLLFSFVFFNVLFSVARNTFARVLCLVLAMGNGIMPCP